MNSLMAPSNLTFVNITGSATLSADASKQVRGHITKKIFAERRSRHAITRHSSKGRGCEDRFPRTDVSEAPWLLCQAGTKHQLKDVHPSFFNRNYDPSAYDDAIAWSDLQKAEPALAEALRAFVAKYYSVSCLGAVPPAVVSSELVMHQQTERVLNMAIERIATSDSYTDELIETTLIMALDAILIGDKQAWDTHMSGTTQLVAARRMCGMTGLSPYFVNQLILDSINEVFGFPRIFHPRLIIDLSTQSSDGLMLIAKLTNSLKLWLQLRQGNGQPQDTSSADEKLWVEIFISCKVLLLHDNAYLRAAAQAAKTILHLSSQKQMDFSEAQLLANQLRHHLLFLPNTCAVIEFTSVPTWLGAVLAERGTITRAWFVNRLARGMQELQDRSSHVILDTLKRELAVIDGRWLARVDTVWNELQHNHRAKTQ